MPFQLFHPFDYKNDQLLKNEMPMSIEKPLYSDDSLDQRSIPDEAEEGDIQKLELLNWPTPHRAKTFGQPY